MLEALAAHSQLHAQLERQGVHPPIILEALLHAARSQHPAGSWQLQIAMLRQGHGRNAEAQLAGILKMLIRAPMQMWAAVALTQIACRLRIDAQLCQSPP